MKVKSYHPKLINREIKIFVYYLKVIHERNENQHWPPENGIAGQELWGPVLLLCYFILCHVYHYNTHNTQTYVLCMCVYIQMSIYPCMYLYTYQAIYSNI